MMHINQYKKYSFADTEALNAPPKKTEEEEQASNQTEEELKRKLEAGEITQAEYQTLSPTLPSSVMEDIDFVDMEDSNAEEDTDSTTFGQIYAKDESY